MSSAAKERSLEETPTWAVAVVCFALVVVSIIMEHGIHLIGKWFTKKHKKALYEALEKVKAELMLMGFISLLLTVLQGPISEICVPKSVGATWHPCDKATELARAQKDGTAGGRKLLDLSDFGDEWNSRRILASAKGDVCAAKGMVPLVSSYGIHQLHIFIFVLAVTHILYCIVTYGLGRIKMRKWKVWEDETKTVEYQYYNDPERFRFTRDTSFGKRHLNFWTKSPISLWIVCFFRQFLTSVTKTDYLTLRHGFIVAHLAPGSETRFDFQKYIKRSLEEDFKVVVGISPLVWLFAVLFLLTYTHGWFSYLWLPFLPLIIILMIGAKLQMIITKMGLHIQKRGDVVKGAPVVKPGDELFWFGRPQLILVLIHFVLFQNAFQIAFFVWSVYEFGIRSCYHRKLEDIIIRISMGVVIQVLCSYVTLPLYALVTQMGSTMKPTIFNERVAAALKNWHKSAKKHTKHQNRSGTNTPMSSRPVTPTHGMSPAHGMSPVHLLHNYRSEAGSFYSPPRISNSNVDYWDGEGSTSPHRSGPRAETQMERHVREQGMELQLVASEAQLPAAPPRIRTQHEINMSLSDFSFGK